MKKLTPNKVATIKIGDFVRIKKGKSYQGFQYKTFQVFSIENNELLGGLYGIKNNDIILYFYAKDLIKMTKQEIEVNKYNL